MKPIPIPNNNSNRTPEMLILQLSKVELKEMIELTIKESLSNYFSQVRTATPESYLTRAEVAQMFQVTLTAINKWSRQGKLNRHYLGSKVFFLRSEIDALFKAPTKFKKHSDNLQVMTRKNKH